MCSDKAGMGRSFVFLNISQFLGALNDNLFKLALIFFLIGQQGAASAGKVSAIAGIVFVVPFLLFSPAAGMIADRVPKNRLIFFAKLLEVVVMIIAVGAFALESALGLYVALFMMAVQSTIFSPAKYGIVPELVDRAALSKANGFIEAFTYLAIILGTTFATIVPVITGRHYVLTGLVCVFIAAIGAIASIGIRVDHTSKIVTDKRSFREEFNGAWTILKKDRYITMAVLGAALFMLVGAFVQLNLIPFGIQSLGLTQEMSGFLFLSVAIGIGVGALLAGKLSGRNVELGVVPLGAIILSLATIILGTLNLSVFTVAAMMLLLGIGGGLFIVPLHAFIQFRSPDEHRGKLLALMNLFGWLGVLIAACLTHLVNETLGLQAQTGFWALGLFMILVATATVIVLPDFLLRFFALVLMRLVYRVKVQGAENVPVEGGALLVANHVSWIDALLLISTQQRRIRFVMERGIYNTPFVRRLFSLMGVIPISSRDGRKELVASISTARKALEEGYLVCIFAEGAITRNGALQEFRPGFEKIVKGTGCSIVPVHLGGVWGSVFSYKHGPVLTRLPQGVPEPVVVNFGRPLESTSGPAVVRQAVMNLSCEYFDYRKRYDRSLGSRFIKSARANWRNKALSDSSGMTLSFSKTLVASILLKKVLTDNLGNEERVGVLIPPSVAGALVNISLEMAGKVPVNLNYTASNESVVSAIKQAEIETIISSHKFLERFPQFNFECNYLFVEDLLGRESIGQKIRAWIMAAFAPVRWICSANDNNPDRLATIIFSSGSTSEPKGVMLSQHNVCSNIESLSMVFSFEGRDSLCGVLPFFHSFGFTGTLWLPMLSGFSVLYHPTPLDAGRIVKLISKNKLSFLLSTPTFLCSYMRKASKEDFSSLRLVVTGAEKLSSKLSEAFSEKFGITPFEGYGATELSPVAAINIPDVYLGKIRQAGSRQETVGRPLPGMSLKITDVDTGEELPPSSEGMIHMCGPNVMLGYLNNPGKTCDVLKDGWYETGDVGSLDAQGFLKITGRLSRFSKIAGEMIPHVAIEDVLLKGLNTSEQVVAVTSVPHEKKGERVVVLFKNADASVQHLKEILSDCELPNLWKPDNEAYMAVDDIPLLGSGKLDLRKLKQMAVEMVSAAG